MKDNEILITISKDLATNTQATKGIEEHLARLNSKVALQEGSIGTLTNSLNTLDSAVKIHSSMFEKMNTESANRKERNEKLAWLTVENVFKLIFGIVMVYLLVLAGLK